jgi:hypothetical protein
VRQLRQVDRLLAAVRRMLSIGRGRSLQAGCRLCLARHELAVEQSNQLLEFGSRLEVLGEEVGWVLFTGNLP